MNRKYDEAIDQHYREVAREHGLSPTSTMADEITRAAETEAVVGFVAASLKRRDAKQLPTTAVVMDVGCGNGYTLARLADRFPDHNYVGFEKSPDLRALAATRIAGKRKVRILEGDIRDEDFATGIDAEILICQRVLINVLDGEDQRLALRNIVRSVRSGGTLLFIEAFASALGRLNAARSEFDLPPLEPANHNLYLDDDHFDLPELRRMEGDVVASNFLSTHYYVTRVLHAALTRPDQSFKRNSEFTNFFSRALIQNAGDYSPLKALAFEKIA